MNHLPSLATTLFLGLAPAATAQETVLYSTDFTTLAGWTSTTICHPDYRWEADATPATHPAGPYVSAPASLNFNNGVDVGGDGVHGGAFVTCGSALSDPIDLTPALGVPHLRFMASWNIEETCEWDTISYRVLSVASGAALLDEACVTAQGSSSWIAFDLALDRSWGEVRIEFTFATNDDWINAGSGVFIDDLSIVDVPSASTSFCHGDGSGTACPCSNPGGPGAGCANSTGSGAVLGTSGSASVAADDLVLHGSQLPPQQFGAYVQGNSRVNGGNGNVFGDGLRCAGGAVVRLQPVLSDAGGVSSTNLSIVQRGGVAPGDTRSYQIWYRDPIASPCGASFNLSNGVEVSWLP